MSIIYYDGKIKYKLVDETGNGTEKTEQVLKDARNKAKYIYHDSSNHEHEIGTYDIVVTGDTYADRRSLTILINSEKLSGPL